MISQSSAGNDRCTSRIILSLLFFIIKNVYFFLLILHRRAGDDGDASARRRSRTARQRTAPLRRDPPSRRGGERAAGTTDRRAGRGGDAVIGDGALAGIAGAPAPAPLAVIVPVPAEDPAEYSRRTRPPAPSRRTERTSRPPTGRANTPGRLARGGAEEEGEWRRLWHARRFMRDGVDWRPRKRRDGMKGCRGQSG